jgi:hypothetical protein
MKTAADYVTAIGAIKAGFLDGLWSAGSGCYIESTRQLTWLNAYMLQTIAILAGQGSATETDKARARAVAAKLTSAPAYSRNSWRQDLDGTLGETYHEAIDQPVAEALYYAYRYRTALALDAGVAAAALAILTENRRIVDASNDPIIYDSTLNGTKVGGYTLNCDETWETQSLARWQLNRIGYAQILGTDVAAQLSQCAKRFVYTMENTPPAGYTTAYGEERALFADFGWDYGYYTGAWVWKSFEYGSLGFGAYSLFYPELATAMALTAGEIAKVKAWQRHVLGQWQRNGYPNWDTVGSYSRIHSLSYWAWSLRALTAMARVPALNQGANDHYYAKSMLDNAIDTFARMDTWKADAADGSPPAQPFGVVYAAADAVYNHSKANAAARFAMELAVAVDLGAADVSSSDPGKVWGWNWHTKDLHVSTPAYDAASLPWAPLINYGTSDAVQLQHWGISRIAKPTGEILTALGGYQREAFSFVVSRSGVTDVDTGDPTGVQPTQTVYRDGVAQSRSNYDTTEIAPTFASSIRNVCVRTGTNYRVEVDTEFRSRFIRSMHRAVLTGTAGAAVAVMSIPARKNVVIEYVAVNGTKTVVWNGTTLTPAGSPDPTSCRYIHMKWAAFNAGLLIIPRSATLGEGAKVTAGGADPSGYPSRQPDQDRSLLIYLADTAAATVNGVEIVHDYILTDGTDAGAEESFAAIGREVVIRRWDGRAWAAVPLKRWNGETWVPMALFLA